MCERETRAAAEQAVHNLADGLNQNSGQIERRPDYIEVNGIRVRIRSG